MTNKLLASIDWLYYILNDPGAGSLSQWVPILHRKHTFSMTQDYMIMEWIQVDED